MPIGFKLKLSVARYYIGCHSEEAGIINGYMAWTQWPTKNLSFTVARPLVFKLRVRFDDRSGPVKRDSSVAVVLIRLMGNTFFQTLIRCESLPQNDMLETVFGL